MANSKVFFPSKLSEYVTDIAERMSCPPDFPGIGMMVTMQAALGSRINCKPYDKNPWTTPGGAWGMLIAPPSSMKSAPLAEAIDPLKKLDRDAANDFKQSITQYEIEKGNSNWRALTEKLEKLTKRDRYVPYADIIYFEMAKIAFQNKDNQQASIWLIQSIKQNSNSSEQRQKAFEQLGNLHYQIGNYAIAKLAYDSLTVFLKTNPNYENIVARKKWISSISKNDRSMQIEDGLLYLSQQPDQVKQPLFDEWLKRIKKEERLS